MVRRKVEVSVPVGAAIVRGSLLRDNLSWEQDLQGIKAELRVES
jgi:hypothetical protein